MSGRGAGRADTVIVGGGIAGVALAYYLARGGAENVVVVERDQLGGGATAASFSGVRQQFSTPLEIELSKRGLRFWKTCAEEFDWPCPFAQTGYLLITSRPETMGRLEQSAALQRELGAGPVQILGPEGVRAVSPWLTTEDLAGGAYTPEDGRVTATDGVAALAKGARGLGVEIRQWWPVSGIERGQGGYRVIGTLGTLDARRVVVAAGIWSPALLEPLGAHVDVSPLALHYALTAPALAGETVPLTIDFDTGFCVEREGPGLAVSMLLSGTPPDYGPQRMLEDWFATAQRLAPTLVDLGISHLLTGQADEVSDGHPNAGRLEDELWVLAGFAGHGVMHGPPVAELLAATMLGSPDPALDLGVCDPLRVSQPVLDNEWMVAQRRYGGGE
ncbi:MAG: NAD(P)/FAD-dependent oxidoreductase [Candidatus Dormibacteria bacterium]